MIIKNSKKLKNYNSLLNNTSVVILIGIELC